MTSRKTAFSKWTFGVVAKPNSSSITRKRTHIIRVIGQFVAKAMLDSRIIDLSFNKVFLKLVLGEEVPLTLETLKVRFRIRHGHDLASHSTLQRVDPELAASLAKIQNLAAAAKSPNEKLRRKLAALEDMDGVSVEDLGLDFTVPGYDIELRVSSTECLSAFSFLLYVNSREVATPL